MKEAERRSAYASRLDEAQASGSFAVAAHDGYPVSGALARLVVYAVGGARHRSIHRVVGGDEIAGRLERGAALVLIRRVRRAVGTAVDGYVLAATAVALVVPAFLQPAFKVFHSIPPLRYTFLSYYVRRTAFYSVCGIYDKAAGIWCEARINTDFFYKNRLEIVVKAESICYNITVECGCGLMVWHQLPKLRVAGSSPVIRSIPKQPPARANKGA